MDITSFLRQLEKDIPASSLTADTALADIENWDSTAVLTFMGMADADYGVQVDIEDLYKCLTVGDLFGLVAKNAISR